MRYRFGTCEIDLGRFTLERDGAPVHVEPQVFDLLALLVENAGGLVTKDQLVAAVWRGLAVSDATIAARISAARAAVGDDGKRQAVIETVPRRGVRLKLAVHADKAAASAAGADRETAQPGTAPEIRYTTSADGTAIAWTATGEGPDLIRTGHWLSHLELDWSGTIWRPGLDRLNQDRRLIRYDIRGTGLSARDAMLDGIDVFVDDLLAVADAAGVERAHLYAPSQAAPVAIAFAARHPDRVDKLVLVGGYAEGRVFRDAGRDTVDEPTILAMIRSGWGRRDSPFLRAFSTLFMPEATAEQMEELIALQLASADPETAVALRKTIDRFRVSDLLSRVEAPTLVIHAERDAIHPISQGQKLAAGIRGAEFLRLDSRSHMLTAADPAWENAMQRIQRFLAG